MITFEKYAKVPNFAETRLTLMLLANEFLFLTAEKSAASNAMGGFARQLLVLVQDEPNASANREFLTKILAAANLDLAQDALLAEIPTRESRALATDLKSLAPKQILVFGLTPAQLGLSFEVQAYQPLNFYGYTWLFAEKLSALEPDKTKKNLLWIALKQIFL